MKLKSRNELSALLKDLNLTGTAAFIGCAECYYEFAFLDRWPGIAYFIDVWAILDTPGFSGHGEDTDAGQEARYQRILARAEKYHGRCNVKRDTSEQAVGDFRDGFFDFVYLDAQHDYQSIKRDLELWYPKLHSGSVFAGHDYLSGHFNGQDYGVKQAVTEFAAAHGLQVHVIPEEWPSFWMVKP